MVSKSDMVLELTFSEMTHVEAALKVCLANFETVASFGSRQYDCDIFQLRTLIVKMETVMNDYLVSALTDSSK